MADAFTELQSQNSAADMGHAEWLGLLIDREVANRTTKRFQSRLRAADQRCAIATAGPDVQARPTAGQHLARSPTSAVNAGC